MRRNRRGRPTKSRRTFAREFNTGLDDIFRTFIRDRKAEGVGENAVNDYEYSFRYIKDFLDRQGLAHDIRNITTDLIRDYIVYMQEEAVRFDGHKYKGDEHKTVGLAPATINSRLKSLRTLFNRLEADGLWTDNIMADIKPLPDPDEAIEILTADELRELLAVPDQRSYAGFRDYVLMNFLLDSMARIGESVQLRKSNFDFEARCVTITASITKSKKYRIIPLQDRTIDLIRELIAENETDFDSEHIFLTNYGEPITTERFRTRLKQFAEATRITKNVYPHLLRHTAATAFLEKGGDIRHLQKLLGHADLRMVQRYTHLSNTALTKQHGQYSVMNDLLSPLERSRKIRR